MYNEAQKNNFITSTINTLAKADAARVVFRNITPNEMALGKDVCTFSAAELQEAVNQSLAMKAATQASQWRILKDYIKWCVAGKIPGAQDNTGKVSILALDKVKTRMVASPMHLQIVLDKVFAPESEHSIDNVTRLFCWCAYAGISAEDAVALRVQDVNLDSNSVMVRDEKIRLPAEASVSLQSCATQTEFWYQHPNYEARWLPRYGGDQLLRGIKAEAKWRQIKRKLSLCMKEAYESGKTTTWTSYEYIEDSGLFYRIYEQERAGIEPNFRAIAREMLPPSSGRGSVVDKARFLRTDYQIWVSAFTI